LVDLHVCCQGDLEKTLAALRPPCLLVQPAYRTASLSALLAPADPVEEARREEQLGEGANETPLAVAVGWPQDGILLRVIVAQRDEWAAVESAIRGQLRPDEPVLTIRKPPFEEMVNQLGARRLAEGMVAWLRDRGHSRIDLARDAERFADEAIEELGPAPDVLPEETARVLREARRRAIQQLRRGAA
jgi:hypothetical protein